MSTTVKVLLAIRCVHRPLNPQVKGRHMRLRDDQDPQSQLRHTHGDFGGFRVSHYMTHKPPETGKIMTAHSHRRWSADGTWAMLLSRVQAAEDAEDRIDWDISVDSTTVRAHQHAAGARTAPPAPPPQKGAGRGTKRVDPGAETGRPAGGGGPLGECLGRSRGGFTTKIHLAADGRCRPLTFVLTPGHYGDGPRFERVLSQISVPRSGVGRPRSRPDHVLADKAYTSRKNRRYLRRRGIRHTIPERLDQQRHRRNRGSRGGRPTGFDSERYKKRNTVERAINRLKGFRAVATRYEKRAYIYLGTITLAALAIWLRT
ncbi:IS5 family transposase [Streptomyces sp. MNP-20]|uniref:IS5 family transposase n=1 Tax=Streptomyces sp. MNP-20 TaxID=2721165 RepID=UPI0035C7C91E